MTRPLIEIPAAAGAVILTVAYGWPAGSVAAVFGGGAVAGAGLVRALWRREDSRHKTKERWLKGG